MRFERGDSDNGTTWTCLQPCRSKDAMPEREADKRFCVFASPFSVLGLHLWLKKPKSFLFKLFFCVCDIVCSFFMLSCVNPRACIDMDSPICTESVAACLLVKNFSAFQSLELRVEGSGLRFGDEGVEGF